MLADETIIPAPEEAPKYPKAMPILQSMGFKGTGGLGKNEQGVAEPIVVKERPKGLGLGTDPEAPTTQKRDLQSTFIPSTDTSTEYDKMMKVLTQ